MLRQGAPQILSVTLPAEIAMETQQGEVLIHSAIQPGVTTTAIPLEDPLIHLVIPPTETIMDQHIAVAPIVSEIRQYVAMMALLFEGALTHLVIQLGGITTVILPAVQQIASAI